MPTATKPKKIDPALEDGAVLLAEEVLPTALADEAQDEGDVDKTTMRRTAKRRMRGSQRSTLALRLEKTSGPYEAVRERIASAITRSEEISDELRANQTEANRKKLVAERTALSGELIHAGADFDAVAMPYAEALGDWANAAFHDAKREVRRIASETTPLRSELYKINQRCETLNGAEHEKEWAPRAPLLEKIRALDEEAARFEAVAAAASRAVSKFGGMSYDGSSLFERRGQRDWVQGRRTAITSRTTGVTGLSNALKPVGA